MLLVYQRVSKSAIISGLDYNQTPEASEHQGPPKPLMAQNCQGKLNTSPQRKPITKAVRFTMIGYLKG